jgi:hypothetical protein
MPIHWIQPSPSRVRARMGGEVDVRGWDNRAVNQRIERWRLRKGIRQ